MVVCRLFRLDIPELGNEDNRASYSARKSGIIGRLRERERKSLAVAGGGTEGELDFKALVSKLNKEKGKSGKLPKIPMTATFTEGTASAEEDMDENDPDRDFKIRQQVQDNKKILRALEEMELKGESPKQMNETPAVPVGPRKVVEVDPEDRENWEKGANWKHRHKVVTEFPELADILILIDNEETYPDVLRNETEIMERNRRNGWPVFWSDLYPPGERLLKQWQMILMAETGTRSWNISALPDMLRQVEEEGKWGFGFKGNPDHWGPLNGSYWFEDAMNDNDRVAGPGHAGAEERWKQIELEDMRDQVDSSNQKYFNPMKHAKMLAHRFEKELNQERERRRTMRRQTGEDELTDAELTAREDSEDLKTGLGLSWKDNKKVVKDAYSDHDGELQAYMDYHNDFEGAPLLKNVEIEDEGPAPGDYE